MEAIFHNSVAASRKSAAFSRARIGGVFTRRRCTLKCDLFSLAGFVIVLLSSSEVAPAHAQSEAAAAVGSVKRVLTLEAAKRLTFQNNWDLLAARSDVDLATAQRIERSTVSLLPG